MNIYLISQDEVGSYDYYDSAIVRAETEDDARNTNPCPNGSIQDSSDWPGVYILCSGDKFFRIKQGD